MKKHIFDIKMWLITAVFALIGIFVFHGLGYILESFIETSTRRHVFVNGILTALFFVVPLIFAWIGMRISLMLNRSRFEITGKVGSVRTLLIALVGCILLAFVTQTLYALELRNEEEVIPGSDDELYKGTHIVLLMDSSDSMWADSVACEEAAIALINGLDETSSLQFIAFATNVMDRNVSDFLQLTASNKKVLTDFIKYDVFAAGGTDFNEPLERALDTLSAHRDPDYRPVILMLTDGYASIDDSVASRIKNDTELSLYTVRITDDAPGSAVDDMIKELLALADKDFTIPHSASGSVDVNDVLNAFRTAISHSSDPVIKIHTKLGFGGDRLFSFGDPVSLLRVIVVIIAFIGYGILVTLAYYGRIDFKYLILNIASGFVFGLLWLFIPYSDQWLTRYITAIGIPVIILYALVHVSALTIYKVEEE